MLGRPGHGGHGAEQPPPGLGPMWPALAEEAARGRPLGHTMFIPLSQASCVVREYADGGHGAVGEPLAVLTVMMQVECYGCAEYGIPRLETASELLLCIASCVCICRVYDLSFLHGTPEGYIWPVVSIFGHRNDRSWAVTDDCYRVRRSKNVTNTEWL